MLNMGNAMKSAVEVEFNHSVQSHPVVTLGRGVESDRG
jgi:hypothetical protein